MMKRVKDLNANTNLDSSIETVSGTSRKDGNFKKSIFDDDNREPKDRIILTVRAQRYIKKINQVFYYAIKKYNDRESIRQFVYQEIKK